MRKLNRNTIAPAAIYGLSSGAAFVALWWFAIQPNLGWFKRFLLQTAAFGAGANASMQLSRAKESLSIPMEDLEKLKEQISVAETELERRETYLKRVREDLAAVH